MGCLSLGSLIKRLVQEQESTGCTVPLSQSHQLKILSSERIAATSSQAGWRGGCEERSLLVTHESMKDGEIPKA